MPSLYAVGDTSSLPAPAESSNGGHNRVSQFPCGDLERSGRAGSDHDIDAFGCEAVRDCMPDTAAAAGHDRAFSIQIQIHSPHANKFDRAGDRSGSG